MSIATKQGDSGQTALVGGARVSKADLRVEAYGSVDELNTFLGFARSICTDAEVCAWTETIQRTLFRVGAALSTPLNPRPSGIGPPASSLSLDDVELLTGLVYRIEATEGILADWSLPGAHRESAAFEICRTVCRRVERNAVRLAESGQDVPPVVLAYLNRLSDLLWLFGRRIEHSASVDARLRDADKGGPDWSRAW